MLPTVLRWSRVWVCVFFFSRFYYGTFHVECYLALCSGVVFSPSSIVITSLREERAGLCVSRAFVSLFFTRSFLSFFFSAWCQGLSAACD